MNRAFALLIAAAAGVPLVGQQPVVTAFRAGGIPVILKHVPGSAVVAAQLYLKGGSANLSPPQAGIERFIQTVSTRGTRNYTRDRFAARAAATGAEIQSQQTYDYSVMSVRAVRDYWDDSWDLFIEAALRPAFPDSEVSLVRQQIVNDLRRREDSPDRLLSRVADSLFFAGHAYAVDPLGTAATLPQLTRDDLLRWHQERMTKENLLLVVVGNVPRADLAAKVQDAFSKLPVRGGTARPAGPLPARPPALKVVPRALPTNYLVGLFAAPNLEDPDYTAMRVALEILSNRLFEEVRSKRGLSYATRAALNNSRVNTGLLYVTTVQPETTLKVMTQEIERLQTETISTKRLGETVNVFLTRYFLEQEANADQASTLGTYEILGGGWRRAATFLERIRAVTPADVQRVVRRYIKDLRFTVIGDSTKADPALFTSM